MTTTHPTLQDACVAWHKARYPGADQWILLGKLTEEVGELARAMIGRWEGRADRGDVAQEAGQVLLVLLSLSGRFLGVDLMEEAETEARRLGATS